MILTIQYIIYQVIIKLLHSIQKVDCRDKIILTLLKENQILKRKNKRPKLNNNDRLFYMAMHKHIPDALSKVILIKPSTILKWHNTLIKRKWDYSKRRKTGRPKTSENIQQLICEIKCANPRWGYRRIMGELKKLGIKLSKSTISNILKTNGHLSPPAKSTTSWWRFIRAHWNKAWCCDFFTIETALLKTYYIFFIIDINSKSIKHFAITECPCRSWLENSLRIYFSYLDEPTPQILITDNDPVYGKWLSPFLSDYFNIKRIRTPIKSPLCNIYAERMVRTFREELTDRMIFFGKNGLHRALKKYVEYYNHERSHYSRNFNAPQRDFSNISKKFDGIFSKNKILGGLITTFSRRG